MKSQIQTFDQEAKTGRLHLGHPQDWFIIDRTTPSCVVKAAALPRFKTAVHPATPTTVMISEIPIDQSKTDS